MTSRKTISLIVSLFVLNLGSLVPAAPRLAQSRVIGRGRPGEVIQAFVLHTLLAESGYGYLTFIAGYDGPLFSSGTVQNESTAYFTFEFVRVGTPAKIFDRGGLFVIDQQRLRIRIFFDEKPNGSFARPATFTDGGVIAEYETGVAQATYDQRAGNVVLSTFGDRQVTSASFTLAGISYTFGKVGDRVRFFGTATTDRNNPFEADAAGQLIQVESGN